MYSYLTAITLCILPLFSGLYGQRFSDVTDEAGIRSVATDEKLMAGGVAWLDYNNDRYPDLLFVNGTGTTRLYRNNWDGTFTDVSETSGLLGLSQTMGVISSDFDGDGFTDLFVSTMNGVANRLLRNNGNGGFMDVSVAAGISEISFGASVTAGDYDGDGDLDIYVTNYLAGELPEEGGLPNFLYRNDGNFNFTEVAATFGLDDAGCGLGAVFSDLNNDGRTDLYVANDFGYAVTPNAYFENNFPAFPQTADGNGTAATINAMGIAKGDYDNDGDTDLYVTNIRENPLFENLDEGNFYNFSSFFAGVALPELTSWGASFTDFDLDGYLDLVIANGQVAEEVNEAETQTYFRNNGDGSFTDASEAVGFDSIVAMGRGLAVADYDLDGYPDLAINAVQANASGGEKARLLHNETTANGRWLSVEVPTNALSLTLYAGEAVYRRETDGGSSYLSHSGGPVHFGAPADSGPIDRLEVTFSNQRTRTYTGIPWQALVGIRASGAWYGITHETTTVCAAEAAEPELIITEESGTGSNDRLLIKRTQTLIYETLPETIVEVAAGAVYRGLARTRDAVLVDTVAGEGLCPALHPIRVNVLPATDRPQLYPNPLTSDLLTLQLPGYSGSQERISLELLNSAGALVATRELTIAATQRTVQFNLAAAPRGAYLIRLNYGGNITHHKIIRQ